MAEIEVYTERYEREHGQKPVGRRFWSFTIVSPINTAKDHFLHTEASHDLRQGPGEGYGGGDKAEV